MARTCHPDGLRKRTADVPTIVTSRPRAATESETGRERTQGKTTPLSPRQFGSAACGTDSARPAPCREVLPCSHQASTWNASVFSSRPRASGRKRTSKHRRRMSSPATMATRKRIFCRFAGVPCCSRPAWPAARQGSGHVNFQTQQFFSSFLRAGSSGPFLTQQVFKGRPVRPFSWFSFRPQQSAAGSDRAG